MLCIFSNLCLQLEILFCDKNMPNDDGFTLMLSLKMKYDDFAKLVGAHKYHYYMKIQFLRTSNSYNMKASVGTAIKYNPDFQLKDAFNMNSKQAVSFYVNYIYLLHFNYYRVII